jgi:uncharacterized membrane protein YbhN (UPF0104 family)
MNKKFAQRLLSWTVIGIVFFFIFRNILKNYDQIRAFDWHFNYFIILLAFFSLFPPMLLLTALWRSILKRMGVNLSFKESFGIYFIGNLGKYVPGKFWQFFMMAYLAKDKGLSAATAFSSALVGQMLSLTAGTIVAFICLGVGAVKYITKFTYLVFLFALIFFLLFLFFKPRLIEKCVNSIATKLGRSPSFRLSFRASELLILIFLYALIWLSVGLTFFLINRSFTYVGFDRFFYMVGGFSAAVVIGFLALFAPGGIGVREGILVLLLSEGKIFPSSVASISAILARLVFTINEIVLFIIAVILIKPKEKGNEKQTTDKKSEHKPCA